MLNLISGFVGALTMEMSTSVTIWFTLSVCMHATMEEPINQTLTNSDTDKFYAKGSSHLKKNISHVHYAQTYKSQCVSFKYHPTS
jgi:hypothetical protein